MTAVSEGAKENGPLVAVVIPNKNGLSHLRYSLPALTASLYPRFFCALVDDGSTDGSVEFVRREFPQVHVMGNGRHKGFAGAVNTGIGYGLNRRADYIAVSNTDIRIGPQWIGAVLAIFRREADAGLVGFTELPLEGEELSDESSTAELTYVEVKRLPGCFFVCPANIFADVGLLDEDYFMYGEDNDFFARVIQAGYRILQTNFPVWHRNEGSGQSAQFLNAWLTYRNGIRCALKNESLTRVIRTGAALLYFGCGPLSADRKRGPSLGRLRRYNIFLNLLLFVSAWGWNLFYLPRTLRLRADARRIGNRSGGNRGGKAGGAESE